MDCPASLSITGQCYQIASQFCHMLLKVRNKFVTDILRNPHHELSRVRNAEASVIPEPKQVFWFV